MFERLLFAVVLLLVSVMVYRMYIRRQLERVAQSINIDPILIDTELGKPTIVYFTTPFCMPCKTQQQPALTQLRSELDDVQVVEIDATEQPDVADRWGVFSAPTTFILDKLGQPREVNHGVADVRKLRRQIEAVVA